MFSVTMASRYIRTQKRHSVLTVCSIAVALALMTMLFTSFSTLTGCLRDIAMDNRPYHLIVSDITAEQCNSISSYVGDGGSCDIQQTEQELYEVKIYFNSYIDDRNVYIDRLLTDAGLSFMTANYELNTSLMLLDRIDSQSRFTMLQYFCLFYVLVIFIALALRLVIDTAFEVSSKERERQFGVLQSIGATPSQIVRIITCEGLLLSVIGIPIGSGAGIALAFAAYKAVLGSGLSETYFTPEKAEKLLHFHVSPLMLLAAAFTGLVWVLLSAYGTGMRIIRMSPMQAISSRSNTVKKVGKHSLFGLLFGWKGKLAARNNRRQFKRYIITVVSLTISITLFASFSVAMDKIENFIQEVFTLEQGGRTLTDLEIDINGDPYDHRAYREGLQLIRDSGYFTDIDFMLGNMGVFDPDSEEKRIVFAYYYSEESYDRLFGGEPPMSYEELSAQDGFLLLTDRENVSAPEEFRGMASIPVRINKRINYTIEEYNDLPTEQQELAQPYTNYDVLTDKQTILYYYITEKAEISYDLCGEAEVPGVYWIGEEESAEQYDRYVYLAGTLEQYDRMAEELYGSSDSRYTLYANIADGKQHSEAVQFIEDHSPDIFGFYFDAYGYRSKILSTNAAVRVGVNFVNLMIALIAIVNMVNILSTGILNRRNEIAAMQCVGMTEGQLYGMIVAECLQYALGAGVVSLLLSEGLIFATEQFLRATQIIESFSGTISYIEPIPRILIAVIPTFLMALLASLIPLRGMQKTPLVDQLRNVD